MIELNESLPKGALVSSTRAKFRNSLEGTSAVWLEGTAASFETDSSGVIKSWKSGDVTAEPTLPNDGNGKLARDGDRAGLKCENGVNCGLVLRKITQNASHCTMAVIYRPGDDKEAQSVLTLNCDISGNSDKAKDPPPYLFIKDNGDFLNVKDTKEAVEIVAPIAESSRKDRLLIVSLSGNELALSQNLDPAVVEHGRDTGMHGAANLYIGCRSDRRGLVKTLGSSIIREVIFWPSHTLLLPRNQEEQDQLTALRQFFLWEY